MSCMRDLPIPMRMDPPSLWDDAAHDAPRRQTRTGMPATGGGQVAPLSVPSG